VHHRGKDRDARNGEQHAEHDDRRNEEKQANQCQRPEFLAEAGEQVAHLDALAGILLPRGVDDPGQEDRHQHVADHAKERDQTKQDEDHQHHDPHQHPRAELGKHHAEGLGDPCDAVAGVHLATFRQEAAAIWRGGDILNRCCRRCVRIFCRHGGPSVWG